MELILNLVLSAVGLAMLCYGGNWLVNGGVLLAKKFNISDLVIGMTVVAYGTSTPELAASIAAAGKHGGIILGNVIGSNIANIGMVIGVAAILIPVLVDRTTLRKEIPFMLIVSFLLVGLSLDGQVSLLDGALLVSLLIFFTLYTYKDIRKQQLSNTSEIIPATRSFYIKSFGLISVGVVLLYFGSQLAVDNAVVVARILEIPERIIGITVIAIGTSLPELITSIIAIKKGRSNIGVGNIIGSNIYNILMIMGVATVIASIQIPSTVFYDYAIMIGFSLSLLISLRSKFIGKIFGIILVLSYILYLLSSFFIVR